MVVHRYVVHSDAGNFFVVLDPGLPICKLKRQIEDDYRALFPSNFPLFCHALKDDSNVLVADSMNIGDAFDNNADVYVVPREGAVSAATTDFDHWEIERVLSHWYGWQKYAASALAKAACSPRHREIMLANGAVGALSSMVRCGLREVRHNAGMALMQLSSDSVPETSPELIRLAQANLDDSLQLPLAVTLRRLCLQPQHHLLLKAHGVVEALMWLVHLSSQRGSGTEAAGAGAAPLKPRQQGSKGRGDLLKVGLAKEGPGEGAPAPTVAAAISSAAADALRALEKPGLLQLTEADAPVAAGAVDERGIDGSHASDQPPARAAQHAGPATSLAQPHTSLAYAAAGATHGRGDVLMQGSTPDGGEEEERDASSQLRLRLRRLLQLCRSAEPRSRRFALLQLAEHASANAAHAQFCTTAEDLDLLPQLSRVASQYPMDVSARRSTARVLRSLGSGSHQGLALVWDWVKSCTKGASGWGGGQARGVAQNMKGGVENKKGFPAPVVRGQQKESGAEDVNIILQLAASRDKETRDAAVEVLGLLAVLARQSGRPVPVRPTELIAVLRGPFATSQRMAATILLHMAERDEENVLGRHIRKLVACCFNEDREARLLMLHTLALVAVKEANKRYVMTAGGIELFVEILRRETEGVIIRGQSTNGLPRERSNREGSRIGAGTAEEPTSPDATGQIVRESLEAQRVSAKALANISSGNQHARSTVLDMLNRCDIKWSRRFSDDVINLYLKLLFKGIT